MTPEKLIKYRRKELKMSMQELADKMGVAKSSVANWETNGIDNMKNSNVANVLDPSSQVRIVGRAVYVADTL